MRGQQTTPTSNQHNEAAAMAPNNPETNVHSVAAALAQDPASNPHQTQRNQQTISHLGDNGGNGNIYIGPRKFKNFQ
jgi:hypothetical protein